MAEKLNKISLMLLFMLIMALVQLDFTDAQEIQFVANLGDMFWDNPGDIEKRIEKAEALIENGQQLQAISEYEKIVDLYPGHVSSLKRLAQLYSWNEKPEKSITCYEKIVEADPLDSQIMKTLAQNYIWNNRQKEAIDLLERVIVLEPDSLKIHKKLAQLYSWNNMPEKLISQYEKIIQLDSTDTQTMKKLAANYSWNKKPLQGIRILEKLITIHPDSILFRKELAQHYEWNNMPKNAISQYEEIIKRDSTDFKLMKKLAQQYLWNNRPADAAELYQQLLESEPDNLHFKMQLANAYLWSNQGKKAEQPLSQILVKQPYNKDALLSLAELQRWAGKWDLAKEKLEKLLLFDPKNEKAKELLNGIRQQYGNLSEARYYRISDSNKLTREQLPLAINYFFNHHWEYVFSAAHYRVEDGRLDSKLIGYGARLKAKYNYSTNTSSILELAITNYSSNWSPFSFNLQFNKNFFDKLFTNIRYFSSETKEGVKALKEKIVINGFAGEFYLQATKRWSLSGIYSKNSYSDNNIKVSATAGSNFIIFLNNPKVFIYGYYSYEDFKNIYSSSLPYWTPDKLSTASLGLKVDQNFGRWLSLGAGYALTNQQAVYSNNYSGQVGINFSKFGKFFFQYVKNGSSVYNAESFLAYLQYRF